MSADTGPTAGDMRGLLIEARRDFAHAHHPKRGVVPSMCLGGISVFMFCLGLAINVRVIPLIEAWSAPIMRQ